MIWILRNLKRNKGGRSMYSSGYNKLFWGTVFIILKINIGPIDILPDFVGYLIMFFGICELSSQKIYYAKGKLPSLILAIISLKDVISLTNNNLLTGNVQIGNPWMGILGSVSMVINIYLMYIICNGICLVSEEKDMIALKKDAAGSLKFYFVISIADTFFIPFTMNFSRDLWGILILFAIINLIAMIVIASLFRRARTQLSE
jgi:hypothetical protein